MYVLPIAEVLALTALELPPYVPADAVLSATAEGKRQGATGGALPFKRGAADAAGKLAVPSGKGLALAATAKERQISEMKREKLRMEDNIRKMEASMLIQYS